MLYVCRGMSVWGCCFPSCKYDIKLTSVLLGEGSLIGEGFLTADTVSFRKAFRNSRIGDDFTEPDTLFNPWFTADWQVQGIC